jgi:hypothetical protein
VKPHRGLLLFTGLAVLLAGTARADDVPTFRKRGDEEKKFYEQVGKAVVKAARAKPIKITYLEHKVENPKEDQTVVTIKMEYTGPVTRKQYNATIVLKIDSKDKDNWKVRDINYSDTNKTSKLKPNAKKIKGLIPKFNR